ncbi:MAG: O-antigen ligase family protein [Bryobacteraceae bacterium]
MMATAAAGTFDRSWKAPTGSRWQRQVQTLLYAFVLALPFTAASVWNFSQWGFGIQPSYAAATLLIGLVSWKALAGEAMIGLDSAARLLGCYTLLTVLSIGQSAFMPPDYVHLASKSPGVFSATQSVYIVINFAVFVVARMMFRDALVLTRAIRIHFAAGAFCATWGIYQLVCHFTGIPYWPVFNNNIGWSQQYFQTILGAQRISSTAPEPSMLALYLLTVVPIVFNLTINNVFLFARHVQWAVLAITFSVLIMTTAFSAFLGVAVMLTLISMLARRRELLIGGVIAGLLVWGSGEVFTAFSKTSVGLTEITAGRVLDARSARDTSFSIRFSTLVTSAEIFLHNPIVGVGEGNYAFYHYFFSSEVIQPTPRTFSMTGRILAEHGLLGVILFGAFLARLLRLPGRLGRCGRDFVACYHAVWVAVVSALVVLLVSMAEMTYLHFWFLCGVLSAMQNSAQTSVGVSSGRTSH